MRFPLAGDGDIDPIQFRHQDRSLGAKPGRNICQMRVMVRILLLKHGGGFTSCHVNSLVRGIEPHIVVQRRTGERGHNFSRISVERKESGWLSRGDKYTM